MIDKSGRKLVVIDFGLCGVSDQKSRLMNQFCGSPAYAAPELVQRIPYNGKLTDVWAMGIILYTLLVGDYPFVGDDIGALYKQIVYKTPHFPSHVSKQAKDLIRRMVTKSPALRISLSGVKKHPWMNLSVTGNLKQRAYDMLITRRISQSMS